MSGPMTDPPARYVPTVKNYRAKAMAGTIAAVGIPALTYLAAQSDPRIPWWFPVAVTALAMGLKGLQSYTSGDKAAQ